MKTFLWLFFLFSSVAQGAYNPFFSDKASSPKIIKTERALIPPPRMFAPLPILPPPPAISMEIKPPQAPMQIRYFGYIESDKGKFALIKLNESAMVLKENNRVYLNSIPYFVREISSNMVILEDGLKQIKTIYFSGEVENKR